MVHHALGALMVWRGRVEMKNMFYFRNGGDLPALRSPRRLMVAHEVILESEDAFAWVEERREYNAISDDKVPRGLSDVYQRSYTIAPPLDRKPSAAEVRYVHAFDAHYPALENANVSALDKNKKLFLIRELLDAVCYLHARGLPHLALNSKLVRVGYEKDRLGLKIVGAGAGPRLVATKRPFALPEEWWPFNAPETTGVGAMIIRSNLRALFSMDSWSVGVLVVYLLAGYSPFRAEPDWTRGIFDDRAAVGAKTRAVFGDFAAFLRDLDVRSDGLALEHPWILRIILGLLDLEATERLTVAAARDIARQAMPTTPEFGRFGKPLVRSPSGEPFRSLEAMVNVIDAGACDCVLQYRPDAAYVPYGEIVGYRNRGDGDRWDVILPGLDVDPHSPSGLSGVQHGQPLRLAKLLGVVLVKGGNHKLAVEVDHHPPVSRHRILNDVRAFIDGYVQAKPGLTKSRVRFLEYGGE